MNSVVLVVGAGPVRLTLAAELARYGVALERCRPSSTASPERSAVASRVLADSGRLTQIGMLKGAFAQGLRNHVASLVLGLSIAKKAINEVLSEISVGYPHGPITDDQHAAPSGPHPGMRVVEPGKPYGVGTEARFVLCAEATAENQELLTKYAAILEPAVRAPLHADGMWLIRPDGDVAVACEKNNPSAVAEYLNQLIAI
jgi:hypothetical protein